MNLFFGFSNWLQKKAEKPMDNDLIRKLNEDALNKYLQHFLTELKVQYNIVTDGMEMDEQYNTSLFCSISFIIA